MGHGELHLRYCTYDTHIYILYIYVFNRAYVIISFNYDSHVCVFIVGPGQKRETIYFDDDDNNNNNGREIFRNGRRTCRAIVTINRTRRKSARIPVVNGCKSHIDVRHAVRRSGIIIINYCRFPVEIFAKSIRRRRTKEF